MKNLALKYSKNIVRHSVKIQDLMNDNLYSDEDLADEKKSESYHEAKYYHKRQRGLIRISKYKFDKQISTDRKILEKRGLVINIVDCGFTYEDVDTEDTKIWYMNFSDKKAFDYWNDGLKTLTSVQTVEMPLLRKASIFLETEDDSGSATIKSLNGFSTATPILFERVPRWNNYIDKKIIPVTFDQWTNIISITSPWGGEGVYSIDQIIFLLTSLIAGFGGIIKSSMRDKKLYSEIHTGNWGCGIFRNNKELIYLAQIYVADVLGVKRLWFHNIDDDAMERAVEKWRSMPKIMSMVDVLIFFVEQKFEWEKSRRGQ